MFKPTLCTLALLATSGFAAAQGAPMSFDVAEDHTRIFMAAQPLHENGMPAHGNAFLSQGYIYPAGTLQDGVPGVLKDGSPAFPDLVLGTWTCDGYFVGEAGNATSGAWVISRQVFAFARGDQIITQGTEIADLGEENLRPITGATGDYAAIEGGLVQTTLGFNEYMALNATFEFETPVKDHAHDSKDKASDAPGRAASDAEDIEWDSGFPVGPLEPNSNASF
ncbi:hypothetical protein [uncultured Roseobacter sp.]|uniref:hypothetical protein n=1 Tax=uncultured Roseobacter sp. TaxID=114847 RepID=UPI002621FD9B|nr:hypothetical protein [uncultured Roseobacter sp.]